jgi:hypothetical protein
MGKIDLPDDVHRASLTQRHSGEGSASARGSGREGAAGSEQDHRTSEVELTSGPLSATSNPMTKGVSEEPVGEEGAETNEDGEGGDGTVEV